MRPKYRKMALCALMVEISELDNLSLRRTSSRNIALNACGKIGFQAYKRMQSLASLILKKDFVSQQMRINSTFPIATNKPTISTLR